MKFRPKPTSVKSAARGYIRCGYSPIPIPSGEKAPNLRGWQKLRLREDELSEYFAADDNVGLLLGEPSRGLVDVDLDAAEALITAPMFLPPTQMVHGRRSKRNSHWWYSVETVPPPRKFCDVDGSCLVEVRSTGQQTLAPPSIHPSGERLRWEEGGTPKTLATEQLMSRVELFATATLLARHYPKLGVRHDFVMALSGMLLQAQRSVEEVTQFISATARAAGDEEWQARARDVSSTAARIANKEPVTSAKRLKELVGAEVVARVQDWLQLRRNDESDLEQHLTDLGNAGRFVGQHADDVRFCHTWKRWLEWDGTRWRIDEDGAVERRAKETVRRLYLEAGRITDDEARTKSAKWAQSSESRGRITSMIELAKSEARIPISPQNLDGKPWLLNCQNGTIDLRTGDLLTHRREDLCTKIVPIAYDPEAACPTFKKFLRQILKNDAELINFLQRAVGYSLTGSTAEQVLFISYGSGANGKSTLLEILRAILGEYGRTADSALLMQHHNDGVRNDVARLAGARFVSTSETEAGRRLAEVLVKQLTGGDKVTARFLYSEFFEFDAQFKLFLTTNHKPVIRGTDHAIWRRIRLIPFEVTIPEEDQDKDLPHKLRAELAGILAWAVRGCLRWQESGLGQPEKISVATADYRAEMDVVGAFIRDTCVVRPNLREAAATIYSVYKTWCEVNGEKPLTQQKFGAALADRGFKPSRTRRTRLWLGLKCRDTGDEGDAGFG